MGPIRFGALPSLTHEGPWCRDAVPTGYKLEQRSYCCRAMGFSLGQWQRHPETKRRIIMVAGSRATFSNDGPPDATQSLWQVRVLDFQGIGKSSAMGQEPTHTIRPAILPTPANRSEFPPAIPRRVASQQKPASASPDTHREMSAEKIHAPNDHRLTRLI